MSEELSKEDLLKKDNKLYGELADAAIGKDKKGKYASEREDEFPLLREQQQKNDLLRQKISAKLKEFSDGTRQEYTDIMFNIIDKGGRNIEEAEDIQRSLEDLYQELENLLSILFANNLYL